MDVLIMTHIPVTCYWQPNLCIATPSKSIAFPVNPEGDFYMVFTPSGDRAFVIPVVDDTDGLDIYYFDPAMPPATIEQKISSEANFFSHQTRRNFKML